MFITLHYNHRLGSFMSWQFDEFSDMRLHIMDHIKDFLLNDAYNVLFEPNFNRVQVWDDGSEVFEFKWSIF